MPRERTYKKSERCGERYGRLCSELFELEYNVSRFKNMLLYLYGEGYKYHEYFGSWPRDRRGNFDENFFEGEAKGFYEYIYDELLKLERRECGLEIYHLNSYVFRILRNKITETIDDYIRNLHEFTFTTEHLQSLQRQLKLPELTMYDIESLAGKDLMIDYKILRDEIKGIPGYRNAYFKIRTEDGIKKLKVFKTQEDIEDEVRWLTDFGEGYGDMDKYKTFNDDFEAEIISLYKKVDN